MKQKKIIDQLVYGFMTLVVLINSLTPLTVFAEGQESPIVKLESISKGQGDDQLDIQITTAESQEEQSIQFSQPVVQQAILEQAGKSTPLNVENSQVLRIPSTNPGSGTIHLTLQDTKELATLEVSYEQQKLTYTFEKPASSDTSEPAENSENAESDSKTETTETSSSKENQQTTDSTTEAKLETSVEENDLRADGPTDIRDYFPNGEGTILTSSNLVYLDEEGNVVTPPITVDMTVRAFYTWSIPEDVRKQIEPGDYFDFKLPDELKPKQAQTGELKNEAGEVYAKYTIDENGNIRFEFTEEVKNQSDITGSFFFDTVFKKDHLYVPF